MKTSFQAQLTYIDSKGGFWSQYKDNSIGRAVNYLYHICGLNVAENVQFGSRIVKLYGKDFATIDWTKGFPKFNFIGEFKMYEKEQDRLLSYTQDKDGNWIENSPTKLAIPMKDRTLKEQIDRIVNWCHNKSKYDPIYEQMANSNYWKSKLANEIYFINEMMDDLGIDDLGASKD